MRIALASDHAGFAEKERLKPLLSDLGIEFEDLGTTSEESVDYPDYAARVARAGLRVAGVNRQSADYHGISHRSPRRQKIYERAHVLSRLCAGRNGHG